MLGRSRPTTARSSRSRCPRSARWPPSRCTCSSTRRSSATSARRSSPRSRSRRRVLSTAFTIFNFLTYGTTAQVARLHGAGPRRRRGGASARRRCGWALGIGLALLVADRGARAAASSALMGGEGEVADGRGAVPADRRARRAVVHARLGRPGLPARDRATCARRS